MTRIKNLVALAVCVAALQLNAQQRDVVLRGSDSSHVEQLYDTPGADIDYSSGVAKLKLGFESGTSLPAFCPAERAIGFIKTDEAPGQNLYLCLSGAWVRQGSVGAYSASAASNGTVTQTGSNLSLVSIASVPAMAPGACRHLNVITDQATAAYNLYLYVDGSQVAQIYSGSGSGWTLFQELFYCNTHGSQATQKLYQRPDDAFHGSTFNYEVAPSGSPSQAPTAVNWASSHTVAIFSLGTNATPLAGVLRITD